MGFGMLDEEMGYPPDGTIDANDRIMYLGLYSGIGADPPEPPAEGVNVFGFDDGTNIEPTDERFGFLDGTQ